ncbi:galactose-1-phosphate uridylyltransferase [Aldersonia kunmingensis]|uniref:galactose-1-phosphate uridylyltransferase n=1 Tax=Aldersonia kunmingensis TaxID=408066 RepID=UPI000832267A|nr:galactose-1-phosphate uridylyltransferase [Aldersonia kunmingensis]
MYRTRRKLADGREILYFDAEPNPREAIDRRDLPITTTHSQARYDTLLGEWVVIASHRQTRTFLPPADQCPLCPSTDDRLTEIPERDYEVVCFENRFPSLSTAAVEFAEHVTGAPLALLRNGFGRCEVLCFTSDHNASFAELEPARARLVVDAWADRSAELRAIDGVEQVFCFENHGEEIGVTLSHPHGQIYAYPFITPRVQKILASVARYRDQRGSNLFGDFLAAERESGVRVVQTNEHWTAFVPPAARWPYEVQLFPHRQVADIDDLDDVERDAFASIYLDVQRRFARRFPDPMPYIAAWNQSPLAHRDEWWLHMQLFSIRRAPGKLKYLAGSESGMNVFINDTTPEDVAAELREVT